MSNQSSFSWKKFNEAPIVGIIRGLPIETVKNIAQSYTNADLSTIEITMNTNDVSGIISSLRNEFPELNVGAGTVCSMKDLEIALNAGSQFIVTPVVVEPIIEYCVKNGIPVFPGAFTPTEIYKAWSLGASAVKVFPATQLGVQYIKDVLAPLSEVKLLPTGGVSKNNIRSFFEAGSVGVGMGSSLINKDFIKAENFNALAEHFKEMKLEIKSFLG